jgi:hypothetical protein
MAGFDVYCTHCYYVHDIIAAVLTYGGGSFLKTLRILYLFVLCWRFSINWCAFGKMLT